LKKGLIQIEYHQLKTPYKIHVTQLKYDFALRHINEKYSTIIFENALILLQKVESFMFIFLNVNK